jgi:quinol monooxygenase YgiN
VTFVVLIIAGYAEVDASKRDDYVAAHHDLVMRCRQAPGCLDVAISPDPVNARRVNVFERWESTDDLEAWRAVANAPDTGTEILTEDVMEYSVADVNPPFG